MAGRKALLIGIPTNDDPKLNLPVVKHDLKLMHETLEASGYTVTVHGREGPSATRARIPILVRDACRNAEHGDLLLIYLSGHGLHYNGVDFLVPSDGATDDPEGYAEQLVPIDFGRHVDQSHASAVIVVVDACREGVELVASKSVQFGSWSTGRLEAARQRQYAVIFSCGPGGLSRYVPGAEGFSIFTRALADALAADHPASTLGEVLEATQERLDQLSREHRLPLQSVRRRFEVGERSVTSLSQLVICNGAGLETSLWTETVANLSLWDVCQPIPGKEIDALRDHVAAVVGAAVRQVRQDNFALPNDPWQDQFYPLRVLRSLELLVHRFAPEKALTAPEAGLLLCAPFVREAMLAAGIAQSAPHDPLSLAQTGATGNLRADLELLHQQFPKLQRAGTRLEQLDNPLGREAVATWLLHRFVAQRVSLADADATNDLSPELAGLLYAPGAFAGPDRVVRETFARQRLVALARCVGADPNAVTPRAERWGDQRAGGPDDAHQIRLDFLAHLLRLAGQLGIDARQLPEVIPEHLGLADPLDPADVLDDLAQSDWQPTGNGDGIQLLASCHHPALDLGLRQHVEGAERALDAASRRAMTRDPSGLLLESLPRRLSLDGLEPARDENGLPVYQTPHIQFRLDQGKVTELLMGEQLYGDPSLAFREMYQNALDACRYRRARLEYLRRTRAAHALPSWTGSIQIRQGRDERGRDYVECHDTGIGMGREQIEECFSQAGRRFHDLTEYIQEQADWHKLDPPIELYPNSQFGIGVFSYFMLADEIEVTTCRFERNGALGETLRVRASGSGSLFRVSPAEPRGDAGTTIRLYLAHTRHDDEQVSCLTTLRQLLRVAEFETTIQDGHDQERWEPGTLHDPERPALATHASGHPDLWWVSGDGELLSDGLRTGISLALISANLRGKNLPRLSVNRREVQSWGSAWIHAAVREHRRSLLDWPDLTVNWLGRLAYVAPDAADAVFDELVNEGRSLPLLREREAPDEDDDGDGDHRADLLERQGLIRMHVDLARVGCSAIDIRARSPGLTIDDGSDAWVVSYRQRVLSRTLRSSIADERDLQIAPTKADAVPIPPMRPSDVILFTWPVEWFDFHELPHDHDDDADLSTWKHLFSIGQLPKVDDDHDIRPLEIIWLAQSLGRPVRSIVERAHAFRPLGLRAAEAHRAIDQDLTLTIEDLWLCGLDPDGTGEDVTRPSGSISPFYLLRTSRSLGRSVQEIVDRLHELASVEGYHVPEITPTHLGSLDVITEDDLRLLSCDLDGQAPWIDATVPRAHVYSASRALNWPVRAVLDRLGILADALQLTLPRVLVADDATEGQPEPAREVAEALDRYAHERIPSIPPLQLSHLAGRLKCSVPDLLGMIEQIGLPDGVVVPGQDEIADAEKTLSYEDWALLYRNPRATQSSPLHGQVDATHILRAANARGWSVSATLERFQQLAPVAGLILPDINPAQFSDRYISADDIRLLQRRTWPRISRAGPWLRDTVPATHILATSVALHRPIGTILTQLQEFVPLGLRVPAVDPAPWMEVVPSDDDIHVLQSTAGGPEEWFEDGRGNLVRVLTVAMRLLMPISQILAHLRKYEPLSLTLPKDEHEVILTCREMMEQAHLWPWPGYDQAGKPLGTPDAD